jgi:ketosteroid isomerase-like protein
MTTKNEVTPEFLARFTQAWNDKDLETLMAHMDEECEFMASVGVGVNGAHWVGREEVRKGFAGLWDNYPDAHFQAIGEDFIVGNRGCCEWIFTGTRKSDGVRIEARGCDVMTFRNGKIAIKNSMRKQQP